MMMMNYCRMRVCAQWHAPGRQEEREERSVKVDGEYNLPKMSSQKRVASSRYPPWSSALGERRRWPALSLHFSETELFLWDLCCTIVLSLFYERNALKTPIGSDGARAFWKLCKEMVCCGGWWVAKQQLLRPAAPSELCGRRLRRFCRFVPV